MKYCEIGSSVTFFFFYEPQMVAVSSLIGLATTQEPESGSFWSLSRGQLLSGRRRGTCPTSCQFIAGLTNNYSHFFAFQVNLGSPVHPHQPARGYEPRVHGGVLAGFFRDSLEPFFFTHDHKMFKMWTPFPAYFLFSKLPSKNFSFRRISALMSQPQDTWLRFLFPSLTSQPFLFLPRRWKPAQLPLMGRHSSDKLVKGYRWLTVH